MFDCVCVGSATQDVLAKSDLSKIMSIRDSMGKREMLCFEYGAKVNVDHIEFTTGGGGTNTAVSFARLGLKSGFMGLVGQDESGDTIRTALEREGVDTHFLHTTDQETTGYSIILTSFEGDRTVLTYRGANNVVSTEAVDWDTLGQTHWVYLSSLTGKGADTLEQVATFAQGKGIKIAFNPGGTQIKRGVKGLANLLRATEVLLLNKEEAQALAGIQATRRAVDEGKCQGCGTCVDVCSRHIFRVEEGKACIGATDTCRQCGECMEHCPHRAIMIEPWATNLQEVFDELHKWGSHIIAITDGSRGVQVFDGKQYYLMPSYPATVRSTLGAGDAFGSAFVAGLIFTEGDVTAAIRYGSANAASVVQSFGAKVGLLTRETVEQFIAEHTDEELEVRVLPR